MPAKKSSNKTYPKIPNHYYLGSPYDIAQFCQHYSATACYEQPLKYLHPIKSELKAMQNKLKIAPVALLNQEGNGKSFGVFTTKSIWVPKGKKQTLGFYEGDVLVSDAIPAHSSFVFDLPNNMAIDALHKRNWTAMVNGALSKTFANVQIGLVQNQHFGYKIEYYLDGGAHGLFLPAGTQLLVFYGSTERYDDFDKKRGLTPDSSFEESKALYDKFQKAHCYQDTAAKLPGDFLDLFDISAHTYFAVPSIDTSCFDVPYLACASLVTPTFEEFAPQNNQENITPLMLACWHGDIARIIDLLAHGANPNVCSSISLISAFHIVIRAPLSNAKKQQIIELLSQPRNGPVPIDEHGNAILHFSKIGLTLEEQDGTARVCWNRIGNLALQDTHEKSILHWAIELENATLVRYLIKKAPELLLCLDCDNRDPLELAIMLGYMGIIEAIFSSIDELSRDHYDQFLDYILDVNNEGEVRLIRAFINFCEQPTNQDRNKINALYKKLKSNFFDFLSAHDKKLLNQIRQNTSPQGITDTVINSPNLTLTEVTMSKKRKKSLSADELYNKAIDYAKCADDLYEELVSNNEDGYEDVLKKFEKALQFAQQAQDIYLNEGAIDDATTTTDELIIPYQRRITWLDHLVKARLAMADAQDYLKDRHFSKSSKEALTAKQHYEALLMIEDGVDTHNDIKEFIQEINDLLEKCKHPPIEVSVNEPYTGPSASSFITPEHEEKQAPFTLVVSPPNIGLSFFSPESPLTTLQSLNELADYLGHESPLEKLRALMREFSKADIHIRKADYLETTRTNQYLYLSVIASSKLVRWSLTHCMNKANIDITLFFSKEAKRLAGMVKKAYDLQENPDNKKRGKQQWSLCSSQFNWVNKLAEAIDCVDVAITSTDDLLEEHLSHAITQFEALRIELQKSGFNTDEDTGIIGLSLESQLTELRELADSTIDRKMARTEVVTSDQRYASASSF